MQLSWRALLSITTVFLACGPTATSPTPGGSGTAGTGADGSGAPPPTTAGAEVTSTPGVDSSDDDAETTAGRPDDPPPPLPPVPPPPAGCGSGVLVDPWVVLDGSAGDERERLAGVGIIDGNLVVHRTTDADLAMLECVREITGDLIVFDNDALVDVAGLTWIEEIGGSIVIADNDALAQFDGLRVLASAAQLSIVDNGALTRVSGFDSVSVVDGALQLRDNAALAFIDGLLNVQVVGDAVGINHNPALCSSQTVVFDAGLLNGSSRLAPTAALGNREDC